MCKRRGGEESIFFYLLQLWVYECAGGHWKADDRSFELEGSLMGG